MGALQCHSHSQSQSQLYPDEAPQRERSNSAQHTAHTQFPLSTPCWASFERRETLLELEFLICWHRAASKYDSVDDHVNEGPGRVPAGARRKPLNVPQVVAAAAAAAFFLIILIFLRRAPYAKK